MEIKEGLSFDDVLLVPKKSSVYSRKDVDVSTILTKRLKLNIPIVSSNMDTVTEAEMAIAMARLGGIGIVHRFNTIEQQVQEVLKVKRAESIVIEQPYSLNSDNALRDAKAFMKNYEVSGIIVVDSFGKFEGILTNRDILFESDDNKQIREIMTKKEDCITGSPNITIEEAKNILHKNKIEKLPLVDEEGFIRGLITSSDILKKEKYPLAAKDSKGRLVVGAAIGVKDYVERTEALLKVGCDAIVVDVAHGHSDLVINTVKTLKETFSKINIIAGNVATADGTEDLIKAGADCVKVGVGPGAVCSTRIVTGAGVPQLTAIFESAKVGKMFDIPIIADGGIKYSGDIAKALASGASTVMIGSLLAGTEESPGITINRNGGKYKIYRGMASFGAALGRKERTEKELEDKSLLDVVPEGVESTIPYKGNVNEIVSQLVGGLKSGISYCGARSIKEMQQNAEFVKMTIAGLRESHPHDVSVIK